MKEPKITQWSQYPQQGDYRGACEEVLLMIGPGLCPGHEVCEGCEYELKAAINAVKAALGQPVSRQRCGVCDALDSIWWERDPNRSEPVPPGERGMWCHKCGTMEPPNEFVELPMEKVSHVDAIVKILQDGPSGCWDSVQIREVAEQIDCYMTGTTPETTE